jgi:hypothetical protein
MVARLDPLAMVLLGVPATAGNERVVKTPLRTSLVAPLVTVTSTS